ncbi:phage tail protein [Lysinibacillus fusiformis]|uniref:Phage tail tape measure protein n=1 Tax=Lysinibacillus fusiformis TaxID=28031 RepID=A0A1E4R764_9BACI|nr:phage tail tape measure protein [Lysinibacillus fusiformis]ODV56208.1 phage tail tape measure protein [Lysinibacillus fusiformis]
MNLTAVFRVRDQGSSRLRQITQAMERMNRTSRNASDSMSRSQAAVNRFGSSVSSTSNRVGGFATRVSSLRVGADGVSASLRGMQGALVGLMGAYVGVTGASKLFSATIGAAANYEQNAMAITGMFGDDKQAKKYLQMVEKAAIDSPVLNSTDMMTNSKAFIGISKNLDELKQVWGLVERIQALSGVDTQQAAFSTKELMQGDYVSMYEAVGLDKKELQKITKMDGMSAKMAGLDKLLTKMGVNDEMVNNMANTTKGLWSQLEEKSQTFFRNIGMESNTKLADFLRRLNKMFDGIDTDALSNKLGGMLGKVTDKAIALYDIFVKWRTQIAYVAGAIGTFVAALAVVGTISALANPIALIAMGISAAVVGIKALYDNSEMFRGAIDGIVGKVKSLWSAFKSGGTGGLISALFPPDIANQINSLVGGIKAKISGLMNAFKTGGFKGVLEMLISPEAISAIMARFATVKEQVTSVFSSIVSAVLPVLQTLWAVAQPILRALWDALKIVADVVMLAWNNIIAPTITFVMKTFQLMWSVIGPILELLGVAIGAAFKVLRLVWDTIVGPFVAFLAGGFTQAFGAATEIVNALAPVFQKVGGWISTAAGYLREFTDILGKVKVPDWIGNIGSGAVSWAKKLLPGKDGGAAKSHYSGLDSVPYDGYSARLHKNEKVLTAQEAKAYDEGQGSSSGGVVITGNNFTVREEADIEKIAYQLAKLIEEVKVRRG